jgi:hypothetical protein
MVTPPLFVKAHKKTSIPALCAGTEVFRGTTLVKAEAFPFFDNAIRGFSYSLSEKRLGSVRS